jgi:hypothetical protein
MQTIKLKYICDQNISDLILEYQKQYSHCLHYNYNRLKDNKSLSEKDLRDNSNNIKNCELIKSYLMQCSIKETKQFISDSDKPIIFGVKEKFESLVDMYYFFKNSKLKYRVSLDDLYPEFYRFFSFRSKIKRIFYYI